MGVINGYRGIALPTRLVGFNLVRLYLDRFYLVRLNLVGLYQMGEGVGTAAALTGNGTVEGIDPRG